MSTSHAVSTVSREPALLDYSCDVLQRSLLMRADHFAGDPETAPERKLMIALVRDAIRCIDRYRHAGDSRGKRLFADEARWVLSNDTSWIFSFARVCETLDLDREAVRRSLRLGAEWMSGQRTRLATITPIGLH